MQALGGSVPRAGCRQFSNPTPAGQRQGWRSQVHTREERRCSFSLAPLIWGAEKARKTSEHYFGTQDEVQAHTVTCALQQQRCSRQGTSKLCRPFHSVSHPPASFSSPRISPPEDLSCFINLNYPSALRNSDRLLLPKAKVVGVEDKRPSATHCSATAACGSTRLTVLAGELWWCDSPAALTSAMLLPASSPTGLVVMCTAWGASLESKILTAINILLISAGSVHL